MVRLKSEVKDHQEHLAVSQDQILEELAPIHHQ
jgi:hypothetical protein